MREVILMMAFHSITGMIHAGVTLTLETQKIMMGRSMIITCTVHGISKINKGETRQFAKGNSGDLLCFNGHITQTRKYEEILSEGNTFSLKINNVTEADVNDGPTENTTVIKFNEYDKSFEIHIHFSKIFPVPKCFVQTKTLQLKFANASVLEERIFYNVSFLLKHSVNGQCGTDLEIYCRVGRSNHYYIKTFQPFMKCSNMFSIIITLTTTTVFILVAFVIMYKNRGKLKLCKRYGGKPKSNTVEEETFLNE